MILTLCVRLYAENDYSQPLTDSDLTTLRLLYASASPGGMSKGMTVPCPSFNHVDSGVWTVDINTAALSPYRTDYYYLQYAIREEETDPWGEWTDVTGHDPFFFNTRVLSGIDIIDPSISNKQLSEPSIEETAIAIKVAIPSTYDDGTTRNPAHTVCMEYTFTVDSDPPSSYDHEIQGAVSEFALMRTGSDYYKEKYIHIRVRVFKPDGEYSSYSDNLAHEFAIEAAEELLDASITDPPEDIVEGDVKEVNVYGVNDGVKILTPSLSRGIHVELAYQFGGEEPGITSGALTGFAGDIVSANGPEVTIIKPRSMTEQLKLYLARRYVGYYEASDWVGVTDPSDAFYEATVEAPQPLSIISSTLLDQIVDYVASRTETADGIPLNRKE